MIGFRLQQNARTPDLGFETDKRCGLCGCVSSAYLEIIISAEPCSLYRDTDIICKGCLLMGVDIIDKGILEQTKKRV